MSVGSICEHRMKIWTVLAGKRKRYQDERYPLYELPQIVHRPLEVGPSTPVKAVTEAIERCDKRDN